jgi:hypothetical protein
MCKRSLELNDLRLVHNGSDSYIQQTGVGDLILQQTVTDADISFQADDGSGGITEYFKLQGVNERLVVAAPNGMKFNDNIQAKFGNGSDLQIKHDSTDTLIDNYTGHLYIRQQADDKDIRFQSDDGSGGVTEYFRLDGSLGYSVASKDIRLQDNVNIGMGSSGDYAQFHDGTNTYLSNGTGDFYIRNQADDKDILFQADDGSGGNATYFYLDGGGVLTRVSKRLRMQDNIQFQVGSSGDFEISHNGTDSFINNFTGDLYIRNQSDDETIFVQNDDGSGGVTTYFEVQGANTRTVFRKTLNLQDSVDLYLGTSSDLRLVHNGSDSVISNATGSLTITNYADDSDIIFKCDDGSGGVATYFQLDGGLVNGTSTLGATVFPDNSKIFMGSGNDLRIYHNGTDSAFENVNGDLYIQNYADDKDIIFQSDDGSGGIATYFFLDGQNTRTEFLKDVKFPDNVKANFGTSVDLQIFHNSTDSFIDNYTGDLTIRNRQDDGDIKFVSDDDSGGLAEYFRLDGSSARTLFSRHTQHVDNIEAIFGNGDDLVIKHNGTNNVIQSVTGDLKIGVANTFAVQNDTFDENMITAAENGEVSLYHNGVKKLDTRTTGIKITGVSEYADNTAAIAGGLTTGDVYRTGDLLKIVH